MLNALTLARRPNSEDSSSCRSGGINCVIGWPIASAAEYPYRRGTRIPGKGIPPLQGCADDGVVGGGDDGGQKREGLHVAVPFGKMIANLVLPLTSRPQSRADGTDERRHPDRSLQHHHIPQKIHRRATAAERRPAARGSKRASQTTAAGCPGSRLNGGSSPG